jgi:WhiB family redox-sensing transcriptional regulator
MSESVRTAFETIHFDDEFIAQNPDLELTLEAEALQITVERMQNRQQELAINPNNERSRRLARSMVRLSELLTAVREEMAAQGEGLFMEGEADQVSERIVGYSAHGSQLIRDLFGDTADWALTESDVRGLIAAIEDIKALKKPLHKSFKDKITTFLLDDETHVTAVSPEQSIAFMGRFIEERMVNQDELDYRRLVFDKHLTEFREFPPEIPGLTPTQIGLGKDREAHESMIRNAIVPIDRNDDDPLAWQADALCAQIAPEMFFPEKGANVRVAKGICGSCDVKDECLDYALQNNERFGVWGGKSERQRRAIAKRNAEKEAVSRAAYFEALRNQRIAAHIAKKASEQTL